MEPLEDYWLLDRLTCRMELVHKVMAAEKARDVQSASWRPRRAESGNSDPQTSNSGLRKSWCFSLSLEAGRDQCPRKSDKSSLSFEGGSTLWSMWVFHWLDEAQPPTLGRAICSAQTTDSNVDLIQKHPHRSHRILLIQTAGHPWPSQVDTQN